MINPDDEIEARWNEFDEDTWVDDPRTKGLKDEVYRYSSLLKSVEYLTYSVNCDVWDSIDISDLVEKEPPPPPSKKHTPNFHKGYNPKQNYNKGGGKRNFNQRRR